MHHHYHNPMHHHHNHTTMPNTLPITLSNSLHHYHDYTLHNHYTVHYHYTMHDTLPNTVSHTLCNTLHNSLCNTLFHHLPYHNCTYEDEELCTLPKVSSLPSLQAIASSSGPPPGTCTQASCAPALLRSCSSVPTSYP
jgi:hypothetical protein